MKACWCCCPAPKYIVTAQPSLLGLHSHYLAHIISWHLTQDLIINSSKSALHEPPVSYRRSNLDLRSLQASSLLQWFNAGVMLGLPPAACAIQICYTCSSISASAATSNIVVTVQVRQVSPSARSDATLLDSVTLAQKPTYVTRTCMNRWEELVYWVEKTQCMQTWLMQQLTSMQTRWRSLPTRRVHSFCDFVRKPPVRMLITPLL